MTARLATHPLVSERTASVLERLGAAGVDVEQAELGSSQDPLAQVRDGAIDLALVGIDALRGSAGDGLTTVAVLPREEVRDVLVPVESRATSWTELPAGARIGVFGARRRAFLSVHRPDAVAVELDGDDAAAVLAGSVRDDVDALIVSMISARAAGRVEAAVEALDPKAWLPAPGQGALTLVARHPIAEATALDHLPTRTALRTELALLDALDAPLDSSLGCLAQPSGRWIRLWAAAASEEGRRLVRCDLTRPLDEPESLGSAVAAELRSRGYALVESR
ncbi:MAG: hypothetical protein AAF389_10665 [Gemmatimonadota bacterium]